MLAAIDTKIFKLPVRLGDKQHQISRGDNYNKFYLLLLFDHRGFGV
mgnify:CR=1 FL=1